MTALDSRRWMALAVLLTGTLLPPLDFFIVNVALPSIRADMRASSAVAQLVVSVYAAAYAVTLILGGRLGDLYGRKRAFVVGMLGFGMASAICGCATSPEILVVGRLLQGVSAAIMAPQSLACIHALFPAREKNLALGLYGATFGVASVAGQLLGGVMISADVFGLGWRAVFLVNLPIIACAVPAALALIRETLAARSERLDLAGAVLLAGGLLTFIIPLIEGRERHWPWWCGVLLASSVPLLSGFWHYQKRLERSGRSPLVRPSLLLVPGLRRTIAATFFFYFLAPFFLTFAVYEQGSLGHGPLAAGVAILPLGAGFLVGPLCSPMVAHRLGPRSAACGMILEVVGLLMTGALVSLEVPAWLSAPLFLIGLGQGMALPALVRLNVDKVDARWAGLAAGLVGATLQVSAAVSVALVGGLFFAMAPDGRSPETIRVAFAVATLAIGTALALAATLSWRSAPP